MNRLPPITGFLWAIASLALAATLYAGVRAVPGFDPFVLRAVQVDGALATPNEAVLRAARIETNGGLFGVDVAAVRAAVSSLPWVRDVRVVRQLPGTLRIEIKEWVPAYLARLKELQYVSGEGHVIIAPLDQGMDYPVITGVSRTDLEAEGRCREALLEWFGLSSGGLLAAEVGEIHVSEATGLTVYTTDGTGIHLGWEGFREKLARFGRLRERLLQSSESAYAVNLDYPDRIIARLSSANAGKRSP